MARRPGGGHYELGVEAAQPYVDRAGGEVLGYLAHGGGQGVQQGQPGGRLQRSGEPFGEGAGFCAAGFGGYGEFVPEVVDVGREVHG